MDIYLLQYNNYFNRIVKKENSLRDYVKNSTNYDVLSSTNFNLNDGVVTSHVFNWCNEWNPDYIIVASEDNIKHRWFVIEWVKRCKGQFKATLRRDVIVDNFETVINAPIFVQKAHLQDNDPMIFNPEGQSYNQIKKSETLLDANKKCVWAIIYAASNQALTDTITVSGFSWLPTAIDIQCDIEDWEYQKFINNNGIIIDKENYEYGIKYHMAISNVDGYGRLWAKNPQTYSYGLLIGESQPTISTVSTIPIGFLHRYGKLISDNSYSVYSDTITTLNNINNKYISPDNLRTLKKKFNGKYIKDNNDRYFLVEIVNVGSQVWEEEITTGSLYSDFNGFITTCKNERLVTGNPNNHSFFIRSTNCQQFKIILHEQYNATVTFKLSDINNTTIDSPFKIYAIPIPTTTDIRFDYQDFMIPACKLTQQNMIATVSNLIRTLGDKIYDVQILPYCIWDECFTAPDSISIKNIDPGYKTRMVDTYGDIYGFVLSIPSSKYFTTLTNSISNTDELKIQNECNKYRLVSPNYAGEFEFNLAKNGGSVDYFTVSCDYKPYQPVIIVQPQFNGLYGQNFNDARGLILSGDFSVPSEQSSWVNYVNNNKTYEQVFNRQIEHMDYVNKVSEVGDVAGAITGTFSGAASGALTGAMATGGNPIGAVVGGVVGAGASAVGGAVDVAMSKALRAENKDYAIDNYNYQLGNIKARPYTINKLGCLNNNFKFFPFIEYYTCTDKEKEALRNKIKYSGMTVNRIGTISEFIDLNEKHFIKGQFIRLEELGDDYHMATVICEELMKGEFI